MMMQLRSPKKPRGREDDEAIGWRGGQKEGEQLTYARTNSYRSILRFV